MRAHELWEQAGKPDGREDEFWHLAERDLQERHQSGNSESTIVPAVDGQVCSLLPLRIAS
jgi:hypothetical protein